MSERLNDAKPAEWDRVAHKATKVYLVGDATSPKTNQWLAMTNSWLEAERLKKEAGPDSTHKVVEVKPPVNKGRVRT